MLRNHFKSTFLNLMILLIFLIGCSQLPKKRTDKLSILQGVTTDKQIEFSIVAPKDNNYHFELRTASGEKIGPEEIKTVTKDFSSYVVHKLIFLREPNRDYNLYVFEGEKIIDQRLVGRGQTQDAHLRLAVASCMDDRYADHFKIWDTLASKNPDYLILIGDNVYADKTGSGLVSIATPQKLWQRYLDVRLTLPLYFQQKLIPVHATWDDHDYGLNDAGENYKYKSESKDIFEAFFAQSFESERNEKGFGVGSLLNLGDFNLLFLDGRSFRSDNSTGSHLGMDQTHWLMTKLKEEDQPTFIIKGDQFFGGYHKFDSFEGHHPQDFESFVTGLKGIQTPFIFLSGDRHMSEIMQFPRGLFGRPSFEITSSPIHSTLRPGAGQAMSNPWRVVSEDSHMNFTLIDNLAQNDHWFLDVETIGENGESFYKRELAVYIKDLQNNLNEVRKKRSGKRRYRRLRGRRR